MQIYGSKKGQGKQRRPVIAPDSAQSKAFVSIMYGLGEGEMAGLTNGYKSVYLEDTPLQNDNGEFNFPNVKVDFRTGTNDQEYIDGFPDVASETAVNVELKHGTPYIKAFNNLDLDALRVRLKWGALRSQNRDNGDVSGVKIDYAIDIKTDNGGWVEALNTSINAKTSDAYERSHRIDLPKAGTGWQLRVRRITPNSASDFVSDKMYVSAITEVIDLKLRYPNTALLGLRYDASSFGSIAKMSARCRGLIIKVPTNYDTVTRTYTGMWDGQFKMAYSNNPAWVYYDLCTAERYGLGGRLTGSMIDKWSLYRLAQYCDEMVDDGMGGQEPRFTVNVYIQSADGAFELLSRLAGVFRAISYWDGASIVLDADIPQDSIYSFSRANVIDGVFEYTGTRSRDRRTVAKVAWDNPGNHFKTEYEYVRDEAAIAKFGVRVADIAAWGCTSRGQAQRAGLWALKSEQLETRMVTFKVGLDGFIPAPAKVIEISDELFAGRATGGRVLAINKTKTVITLDRTITAKQGDTLVINGDDGTSQRRQIKSVNRDRVTVTKPFADIGVENVWVLDSQDLATMKFRVLSVTADENHQFTIAAVQYNPAKYDAIDHGAYIDDRPISVINPTVQAPTKSVNLSSYHTVNQGVSMTTLVIGWEQVSGAVKYQVEWRKDSGNWQALPPTGTNSIEIAGVYAGQYEARVTAISAFGQASLATHSALTQIQGKVGKPNRPAFIRATGVLFGMNLTWGFGANSADTNYTEIEVSPDGRSNISTLGTFAYPTNKHEITGLQGNLTQFYRARIVDKLGNVSDWTDWTSGTTSADAAKVLDLISGHITESHLDRALREPIAKIADFDGKFDNFDKKISKLDDIDGRISRFSSRFDAFDGKIPTIEQAVQQVNARLPQLNRSIDDLMSDKNAKTQEIASIKRTLGNTTTQIRDVTASTSNLTRRFSELAVSQQHNQDTLSARIQTVQDSIVSNEQALSRRISELDTAYKSADTQSNAKIRQLEQTQSTNSQALFNQIRQAKAEFASKESASNAKIRQLEQSIANKDSAINEVRQQLTSRRLVVGATNLWAVKTTTKNTYLHQGQEYRAGALDAVSDYISVDGSTEYTAQIWTIRRHRPNLSISYYDETKRYLSQITPAIDDVRAGEKFHTVHQFTTPSDAKYLRIGARNISSNDARYKLERGNVATDFSVAIDDNTAVIDEVKRTLTDKERSLSERISSIDTEYKQADRQANAKIGQVEQSISDKERSLSERISQLDSAYKSADRTANAKMQRLEQSLSSKEQALSERINRLDSEYKQADRQANAKIGQVERTLTQADSALSERIGQIDTAYKQADRTANAKMQQLEQTQSTNTQALFSQIRQAKAEFADKERQANARIGQVEQSISDKERALSERVSQLSSTLQDKIDEIKIGGNNLWCDKTTQVGKYLSNGRVHTTSGTDAVSDYISVDEDTDYVVQIWGVRRAALYVNVNYFDADKRFIKYYLPVLDDVANNQAFHTVAKITTPRNAKFVRISARNLRQDARYQLEKGNIPSDYRPCTSSIESQFGASANALNEVKSNVERINGKLISEASRVSTLQTTVARQTTSIRNVERSVDGVRAIKAVTVDNNGVISGYGLMSELQNGRVTSQFGINADSFYLGNPRNNKKPFVVYSRPTVVNGVRLPAGAYLNGDFIATGSVSGDKITANTSITAPTINGGQININDRFLVDRDGNMTAKSGLFEGEVRADKITGKIGIENVSTNVFVPHYACYHLNKPYFFNANLTKNRISNLSAAAPGVSASGNYVDADMSYSRILASWGGMSDHVSSPHATSSFGVLYQMRVEVKRETTIKQKLIYCDDFFGCWVDGDCKWYSGIVHSSSVIKSFSLSAGRHTISYVLSNTHGFLSGVILLGDFIDNDNIKFVYD
ncbi:DUF1983 domain-containing protein [Moraxella bovoculi]|uniref:TipJ family phage tail tip protein n=1 Tax=Moraxella bovoculi TaxID=386891 RepID=UPI00156D7676|nr:phage tail protein [Moraxella bovoculi]NSM11385.1 DUF1983 domain-containing protein [Moraxella bovoculi]